MNCNPTLEIHVFTRVYKEHCIVCFHWFLVARMMECWFRDRWRPSSLIYLLSINIFEQRLPGGSRGGRPDTQSSCHRALALASFTHLWAPFSTFQCSSSGFRRPFSRSQSRFFGVQSQSLKSLAPRCPPGSTLEHFGHQFGISFRWFRLLFWCSF